MQSHVPKVLAAQFGMQLRSRLQCLHVPYAHATSYSFRNDRCNPPFAYLRKHRGVSRLVRNDNGDPAEAQVVTHAVGRSLGFSSASGDKRRVLAALAADVDVVRPCVGKAERAREIPRGRRVGKRSTRLAPPLPTVRPAEEHAHVHAGHVRFATAAILRVGELGASVGTLLVGRDENDPAECPTEARPGVPVARGAVIGLDRCRGRCRGGAEVKVDNASSHLKHVAQHTAT